MIFTKNLHFIKKKKPLELCYFSPFDVSKWSVSRQKIYSRSASGHVQSLRIYCALLRAGQITNKVKKKEKGEKKKKKKDK